MTGLAVQSSILAVTVNSPTTVTTAAAGSLVLAIFRNARIPNNNNRGDVNDNSHIPHRRRRKDDKDDGRSLSPSSRNNTRKAFRRMPTRTSSPYYDKRDDKDESSIIRSNNNNPLIQIYRIWMRLPQIFRFFMAGNLGNLGFFFLEKVIFQLLSHLLVTASISPSSFSSSDAISSTSASAAELLYSSLMDGIEKYQDGLSFFSAYLIQIVTTHLLYAFLVYGMDTINTYEKYSKTLWGQFKVYGLGLFGATALNTYLIGRGFDKTMAFWGTTATFAVFNYFLISWVVKNAIESSASSSKNSSSDGNHDDSNNNNNNNDNNKLSRRRPEMRQQRTADLARQRQNPSATSNVKRINRGGGGKDSKDIAKTASSSSSSSRTTAIAATLVDAIISNNHHRHHQGNYCHQEFLNYDAVNNNNDPAFY